MKTFTNPIDKNKPAADPFVFYHDGYYYSMVTEAVSISIYRSKSVDKLFSEEKKTVFNLCKEVQGHVWAPEIHYNPKYKKWYIYSSGSTNGWDFPTIRMFCLESTTSDIWSDYIFKGYTDKDVLAIDQTVFYDEKTENLYTAFSQFTKEKGQVITFALMENPWTISKARIQLSYPMYDWEKLGACAEKDSRVNEGPIFLYKNEKLFLIYSASGCWSEYYRLGLVEFKEKDLLAEKLLNINNWKKYDSPVFAEANEVYGVGHCSFFSSPDGSETWIAYHGMSTPDAGEEGRYAYLQKIDFNKDGIPVLGEPLSRETKIPFPSSEEK